MHLVKIQLARSIWLFDTAEMNPQGVVVFPALLAGLVERYAFRKHPSLDSTTVGDSIRFEFGQFSQDNKAYEVSLEIYADGIAADSRHSTDVSDLFILDVIKWICNEVGSVPNSSFTKNRVYRSEIVVAAQKGLLGLCERVDKISALISGLFGGDIEPTGLHFGKSDKLAMFTFERRLNEPFSTPRFFSAALTETGTHIKILDSIGKILLEEEPEALPDEHE
jgi:hypothetical protein